VERLERTIGVIKKYPGATVMDIGAGSGRFIEPILKAGASRIVAIEPAPKMVDVMQQLVSSRGLSNNVEIIQSTFLELDIDESFDIVIAIGLYDYIKNPLPYLVKTKNITKKTMVASFPIANTWRSYVRKVRLGLRKCPVFFYDRESIDDLLTKSNFSSWRIDRFGQLLFVTSNTIVT